ncbi:MAG: hypothetical protein ACFE9L_20430 [Candidatus Hodarchaeota archaeon]
MEEHIIKKVVLTGRFSQSGQPSSIPTTTSNQRTSGVDIRTLFTSFTSLAAV